MVVSCSELIGFWTACKFCHFVFFKNYFTHVGKAKRVNMYYCGDASPRLLNSLAAKRTCNDLSEQLVPLLESNQSGKAFASSRMQT